MELPGSSLQSSGVVMELTGSCHGVVWMFPLSLGFLCHGVAFHCHGVDWELSSVSRSCHGVDQELSSVIRSCHGVDLELSSGAVMELSWSCPLSLRVVMEL